MDLNEFPNQKNYSENIKNAMAIYRGRPPITISKVYTRREGPSKIDKSILQNIETIVVNETNQ